MDGKPGAGRFVEFRLGAGEPLRIPVSADGRYALQVPATPSVGMRVVHEGTVRTGDGRTLGRDEWIQVSPERGTATVDFVLERGALQIEGIVLSRDGHQVPGAIVGATFEGRAPIDDPCSDGFLDGTTALAGPDGQFRIAGLFPGRYTVGGLKHPPGGSAVVRDVGVGARDIVLRLHPGGVIAGRVIGDKGDSLGRVDLTVEEAGAVPPASRPLHLCVRGDASGRGRASLVRGGVMDGRFTLWGLRPGAYIVSATSPEGPRASAPAVVPASLEPVALDLALLAD